MKTIQKILLVSLCLFSIKSYNAQIQFEQILPPLPAPQTLANFPGVMDSSISFVDIDGDNDQDVLITGNPNINDLNYKISNLYVNDGLGNFVLKLDTPFDGVSEGSIAFADVDGDDDQDVLITGENNLNQKISKLYINDGIGNFTLLVGTPFVAVRNSSIAFTDVDGDNDQDVLITGNTGSTGVSKLYINDGTGNFTLMVDSPFEGVKNSSIAFADIDGDNDQDVLITGYTDSNQRISNLYINDGIGNYSLMSGTPFYEVSSSSIAFADVDGDNDQDVLITGGIDTFQRISKLYLNDGAGNFTLVSDTPFVAVRNGSIAFADIDGDTDQDLLITGKPTSSGRLSKLYINDGSGTFTLMSETPFYGVEYCSIAFTDVDGDNDKDVLITGDNGSGNLSKLYTNDGTGNFSIVSGTPFYGVENGSIAFADVDSDNDQDVLITGLSNPGIISELYINDGIGNFTILSNTIFEGVYSSSIAFADVDSDNDQDVLITGYNGAESLSKLYINDGVGNFILIEDSPFEGVQDGSIAFADIDGDNDQDVLITGRNNSDQKISNLYINDGVGSFTLVTDTPFDAVYSSSIAFADIDGDNDQDVLITGRNSFNDKISKLYINDSLGNFTLTTNTLFVQSQINAGSIAFADVDNDNDQDVLITGHSNIVSQIVSNLYINDGIGNFSLMEDTPFEEVIYGSIMFADIDGDNDQDVLITGHNSLEQKISSLYTNNGIGSFTLVSNTPFEEVASSSIAFADIDGDNDPDVLITGYIESEQIAKVYRNNSCFQMGTDSQTSCNAYTWLDGNTYTTSNNSANYTFSNVVGCDSLISLNLSINSNTGIDFQVACNTYTWINDSTYTTTDSTSTHTLTNVLGCDSVVTLNLTINTVDVSVTSDDPTITADAIAATYSWLDCNDGFAPIVGETNQDFTALINGIYAVEVMQNGCLDTSTCITISLVNIIEKDFDSKLLKLYPNPSSGLFNIDFYSLENVGVNIFNIQGELIYTEKNITKEIHQFDLNIENGIYFIEILSNKNRFNLKLIKEEIKQ